MLISLKSILAYAQEKNIAVAAFNTYNLETLMGVMSAAEELSSPVIIQVYSRLFKEGSAEYLTPAIVAAANRSSVPVCFHLDHGAGITEVTRALRFGCTGVMIDGSALPYDENSKLTGDVVKLASHIGVSVEGELGHVGTTSDESLGDFTEVADAVDFVSRTGVEALAVQVGTAHGRYKKPPKLDIGRIKEISEATKIPIVLHGGSGIPDEEIIAAIKAGIRKVNFGTDLCYSFLDSVFATSRSKVAVDVFMKEPIEAVKLYAMSKIELLRSAGTK